MGGTPHLSIVIPAFNEASRLPSSLATLGAYLESFTEPCEVIVVVEKSRDETLELAGAIAAKQANLRVIDNRIHRGKGYAVRTGMLAAAGEIVLYMDADLSVPVEEVAAFLDYLHKHPDADVVAGNRQHHASQILKRQSWLRRSMGQCFNLLARALSPVRMRDTQCGFKAFRREAARAVFTQARIDGFAFDVEALLLAERMGFKVVDLPVRWINSEASTVRLFHDSLQMLRDLWTVRAVASRMTPSGDPIARGDS